MKKYAFIVAIAGSLFVSSGRASAAAVDFVKDIQPILAKHCYECHGATKQKSGLRLDIKSEALKGGDAHAPNIIPGKAKESPLIRFVSALDKDVTMPPRKGDAQGLSAAEIATLTAWIDQGAVWPDGIDVAKVDDKRDHWSFKPLASYAPPTVAGKNPIDTFISAKLAAKGLKMSPEADRRTLIRRLYFILHGLPPTPEQVEAFVADKDPQAFVKLVDKLLASPRYGERWARHWLDVIAFGETHGFEVNTPRENAWPYRDYLIQAFNSDTPYPQFIMEQLAGDTLGVDAATGFMVSKAALLPGQIGKDEESKLKARQDELNDMVATAGGAFLGLTLHCARCHNHKFDPVTQADYFSIQAIFAGVKHGERPWNMPGSKEKLEAQAELLPKLAAATHRLIAYEPLAVTEGKPDHLRVPVHARRNVDRFGPVTTQKLRFTALATSETNRYEPCIDELEIYTAAAESRNVALASAKATTTASSSLGSTKHRLEHLNDGLYGNDRSWISKTKGEGWVEVRFATAETVDSVVWGRDRLEKYPDRLTVKYRIEVGKEDGSWQVVATSDDREEYPGPKASPKNPEPRGARPEEITAWHLARGEVAALEKEIRNVGASPMVYAGNFVQPGETHILYRGEAMQPRETVTPGAVTALPPSLKLAATLPERERRVAFAKWLTDPANPLPARVLVNRLWQHHFGEGIVSTPSDFGRNGARPVHPELLDFLASSFIRSGWSIKEMQRLIVTSAAWKQQSAPREDGMAADAQSRFLWRFPPRRLEAEALRDSMLAVAGSLDLRMGGPGFSVFAPNNNYVRVYDPKAEFGPPDWRRMIYMTKVRVAQDATFGAFDCPDAGQDQPMRPRSTTPLQALNLFNSHFVTQQAGLMAARLEREAGKDVGANVRRAFELAFQREPTAEEARVCETLVREQGLSALCRVIMNANEFLFVP